MVERVRMWELLEPFLGDEAAPDGLMEAMVRYLEVLVRWNGRTNLTAVREPEEMVRRHFGESFFATRCLAGWVQEEAEILDLGSGAGFPGLPVSLLRPRWRVTLAESQGKKAAFLREAVRVTGSGAQVWAARSEGLAAGSFDAVMLRAVDDPERARLEARRLVRKGGVVVHLLGPGQKVESLEAVAMPGGRGTVAVERV